ncbi:oxysterol-binding protein-related protein 10 isoform X2 [Triplophysa dalaica]|uniref:oxysterol-binding protein-related protein 10 isoform X2 n=1 Tax=Triplophysa dalaica TaxID=1582913 RepID=UPI0024DF952A|nr:oxysterol-binding protein-related protein 10 isoform X2 [Triplophysa dalaica]
MEKTQERRVAARTDSASLGSPGPGCAPVGNSASPRPGRKRVIEGVLSKYTNLIQGWQNRYFVLDPELGQLQYFVNEQGRSQKPRGSLPLIGACVTSSDEAPHMFIVSSANRELFKLRAADATEQHVWMTQIQACSRRHSDSSAKVMKLKDCDELLCVDRTQNTLHTQCSSGRARSFSLLPHVPLSSSPASQRHPPHTPSNIVTITHHKSPGAARRAKNQYSQRLLEVREVMNQAEGQQKNLVQSIESLPMRGPLSCLDQDLLLLKATSAATLSCLGECLTILQPAYSRAPPSDNVPVWSVPKSPSGERMRNGGASAEPSLTKTNSLQNAAEDSLEGISVSDEEIDEEDNVEEDLDVLEERRSVILQLCSQLKLGMDLTRVVLPTFILEKRSLLEMYSNFMAHPDLFLAISAGSGPEERMVRFLEYYLTAFHEGSKGAVTKKPYNPMLGETFHCSWEVQRDQIRPLGSQTHPVGSAERETNTRSVQEALRAGPDCCRVRFVAEQVSHHPPVSGFYCECAERGMCVNTHVWTKSKFMGMSVGVSMVGEGLLYLRDHGEEYVFTFPSAYARSILTVPWVELGGKVTISCVQTGYSANVTFHTKPFYGGKVHRVTADVKQNSSGIIVCKAQGEWNGTLEFTYSSGEPKVIDTSKLTVIRKLIRPVEKQGRTESSEVKILMTSPGALDVYFNKVKPEESHKVIQQQPERLTT